MKQSIPILSRIHENIKVDCCFEKIFWNDDIIPEPRTLFNISLALVEDIHPPRGWK